MPVVVEARMSDHILSLLEAGPSPGVLVVGDIILDRYRWGDAERISPEAPIPVLRIHREEDRLGGAGNVAAMLAALGAQPILVGVTGNDAEADVVRRLLRAIQVDASAVLADTDRCTTLKERLLGGTHHRFPQQIVRVDREDRQPIAELIASRLLDELQRLLPLSKAVLVSDYNKGLCAGDFVPRVIELAKAAGVPVIADPVRGVSYCRYQGCACITPNRTEAAGALGVTLRTPQEGLKAAQELLQFGVESAAVTMDRDGIAWADQQGRARLFPTRPRQVCDVTGAGDMVLSALGYCVAAGVDWETAIELANLAGGLEVERLGVVPIMRQELLDEWRGAHGGAARKIVNLEELMRQLSWQRQAGRRIVMTNGCFDLLHPGHVASLEAARKLGDCLVVGLNSDRSVQELKGPTRPVIDEQGRADMLAALQCVDYVVIFDDTSVGGLVERIVPDVLVKSAEYDAEKIAGRDVVRLHGGEVVTVPMKPHYSTSRLIHKVREAQPQ
jgi:D-beta-D-heptose 7-phosphate kinase / D-beta-D-heptose 1-phosphate adenosyltransferase